MFTIVLVDPKIPQNTGNIARLCAANDCCLHLVGDLGFELDDSKLKRAGMDYWQYVFWEYFPDTSIYFDSLSSSSIHLFTSKVTKSFTDASYKKGDLLVFGSETLGLSSDLKSSFLDRCITIPMYSTNSSIRCLNLSNSVAIATYEAFRQVSF